MAQEGVPQGDVELVNEGAVLDNDTWAIVRGTQRELAAAEEQGLLTRLGQATAFNVNGRVLPFVSATALIRGQGIKTKQALPMFVL